eukprot:scaffold3236_cov66-Cylindrotheca_fusiformis.AAC.30
MRGQLLVFLRFSILFRLVVASERHLADPVNAKVEVVDSSRVTEVDQHTERSNLRKLSLTPQNLRVATTGIILPRSLQEGGNMNMDSVNMDNIDVDEYLQRPMELFSTPISEWTTTDWIMAIVLFCLLSCLLSCLARIGCGCCNLLNCLACYCCINLCCGDPDSGAGNYVSADGLC